MDKFNVQEAVAMAAIQTEKMKALGLNKDSENDQLNDKSKKKLPFSPSEHVSVYQGLDQGYAP